MERTEQPREPRRWMSLTMAARAFGISGTTLSKLVKEGKIQSKKNPRDRRLTLLDLNELKGLFPDDE